MKTKLAALCCFGLAFAFVEAAVVVYLRKVLGLSTMISGNEGYSSLLNLGFIVFVSLPGSVFGSSGLGSIEFWREVATIIMIASVALLASKNWKQRAGAFLIVFSLWDIFYYIFLKMLINWPTNILDPDIFFLIPVAWIGPVITAIIISMVLGITGVLLFFSTGI